MTSFLFGDFVLDERRRQLLRSGRPVEVQPLTFDLLAYLVHHRGRVVSREDLLSHVWAGTTVSRGAVGQAILQVRRALGEDGATASLIRTVRGRGFQFCGDVQRMEEATDEFRAEHEASTSGVAHVGGRESDLEMIRALFGEASTGSGSLVLVGGEPGIGKTTLLEAAATQLANRGALVVRGGCREDHTGLPLGPWARVMQKMLAIPRARERLLSMGRELAVLLQLFPALQPRTLVARAGMHPAAPDAAARARAFAALDSMLSAIGEVAPVVLLLDDFHAADPTSMRVLASLAPNLSERRCLVVVAYRDTEALGEEPTARLLRDGLGERMRLLLRGLPRSDAAELLAVRTGRRPSVGLIDEAMRLTGGNPFLLHELSRALEGHDGHALPEALEHAFRVPDRALAVARRSLERVPESLQVCALLGRAFSLELAAEVLGEKPARLMAALSPAREQGLLEMSPTGRWTFTHALIWQALHRDVPSAHAARIHERAAAALEPRVAGEPELAAVVAHHLLRSSSPEARARAADHLLAAGEQAFSHLAFEEAASAFGRAHRALALAGEPARAARAAVRQGEALRCDGRLSDAIAEFEKGAALAREAGASDIFAEAAIGYGRTQHGFMDARLVELLREAIDRVDPSEVLTRARLSAELAFALRRTPVAIEAVELAEDAVALAEQVGDPQTLSRALQAWRWNVRGTESAPELLRVSTRAIERAEAAGDLSLALDAHILRIGDRLENGDGASFDHDVEMHRRTAEQLDQRYHRVIAARYTVVQHLLRGHLTEAEAAAEEARARGHAISEEATEIVYFIELFLLRREQGRMAELEPFARGILALLPDDVVWRAGLALIYACTERPEAAREEIDAILGLIDAHLWGFNYLPILAFVAESAAKIGHVEAARVAREKLAPHADRHVCVAGGSCYWGPAKRYLGLACAAMGDADEAREHLERAWREAERVGSPHWTARIAFDLACVAIDSGAPAERIAQLVSHVHRVAHELGLTQLAAEVRALQ